MDEFVGKIRDTKTARIAQPIQRKFDLGTWAKELEKIDNPSENDKRLYDLGVWVSKKLTLIRGKLPTNVLESFTRTDLIRSTVGGLNRVAYIMSKLTLTDIESIKELNINQLIQGGFPSINGQKASPDAILETLIDASRFPLRIALAMDHNYTPSASHSDEDKIDAIIKASIFGQYYSEMEIVWNGGLWEGTYIYPYKEADLILLRSRERSLIHAVASHRRQSLQAEMFGWELEFWRTYPQLKQRVQPRLVINIYGKGRQQKYKLEKAIDSDLKFPFSHTKQFYAIQEYLEPVIKLPLPDFGGLTVSKIIQAWELLESLGASILQRLPTDPDQQTIKGTMKFAPVVHTNKIIPLFAKALEIDVAQAERIIGIFTSDDSIKDELWFKPLIRLEEGRLLPVLSPILHGSFLRLIEYWMKEGGIDLEQRGKLFEEHSRLQVQKDIRSSKILKRAGVYPKDLKRQHTELDEEIDIVLWMGNSILIGEAKCILYPASSNDYHNYYKILEHGAEQAKRKAEAARRNIKSLINVLGIEKQIDIDQVSIVPFVLINQVLAAGFVLNEVPVIDMYILTRYLDGRWVKMGRFENGDVVSDDITYFYDSEEEAGARIGEYLFNPPQIKLYKDAGVLNDYKFPILDSSDRPFATVFHKVELMGASLDFVYPE